MRKVSEKDFLRIVDANFNRAKEGLRVCEDTFRFIYNKKSICSSLKQQRHRLTDIVKVLSIGKVIDARDILNDVGRRSNSSELKRKDIHDIIYANMQRVKESLRVLEEFAKLKKPKLAEDIKMLRYRFYETERRINQIM